MTSKKIVELLCELVDLKELTNRGLILKDINNFQDQLEKDLEELETLKEHNNENKDNYNKGDDNIGYYNIGYLNTGCSNRGDCNTGNYNKGDDNTGYDNKGDYNIGLYNTGDWNVGYCNKGDYNIGIRNKTNYACGLLNTQPNEVYLFNKPSGLTLEYLYKENIVNDILEGTLTKKIKALPNFDINIWNEIMKNEGNDDDK